MNSKSIKKLIKSIIFVVLFATMLAVLCEVFTPKTSDLQIQMPGDFTEKGRIP